MAFIGVSTCIEQISGSQSNSSQKQYKEVTLEESDNLESLVSEWNYGRQAVTDDNNDYMQQFLNKNESFKVQMKLLPRRNPVEEIFSHNINIKESNRNANEIIARQIMEFKILEKKDKFSKCHTDYTDVCELLVQYFAIVCCFMLSSIAFFTAGLLATENRFCLIGVIINLTIAILSSLISCLSYYLIVQIFFLKGKNNQYILLDHINRKIYEEYLEKDTNYYLYKLSKILTPQVSIFLSFIYCLYSVAKVLAASGIIDQPEVINDNNNKTDNDFIAILLFGADVVVEFLVLILNFVFWCSIKSFTHLKDHLFTTLTVSYGSKTLSFINKFIASLR